MSVDFNRSPAPSSRPLYSRVLRRTTRSVVLKLFALGLGFAISVALARTLGAAGYGAYAYGLSWLFLVSTPSALGYNKLLVREVAAGRATGDWGLVRGIMGHSTRVVLVVAGAAAICAALVTWLLGNQIDDTTWTVLLVTWIIVPIHAVCLLQQASLRGLGFVIVGQAPELLVRPLTLLALLGLVVLALGLPLDATGAMTLYLGTSVVQLVSGAILIRRGAPRELFAARARLDVGTWTKSSLALFVANMMFIVNARAPILVLGLFHDSAEVGRYHVAARLAEFLAIFINALNLAVAPTIAELHARGEHAELQRVLFRSTRRVLALTALAAAPLLAAPGVALRVFGEEFADAEWPLVILCLGKIANALTGPVGLVLAMTGHERDSARIIALGAVFNVVMALALCPGLAGTGAAIAEASALAVWNGLLAFWVWKRLGINATAASASLWRRSR